ncbi:MAG: hypothetical protein CME16_04100 [Gemmatimonadetes bacterium]|nr:hypothetical protein [Gemmatimonadota bacterium]
MNKAARSVLRKLGNDQNLENEQQQRIAREVEGRAPQSRERADSEALDSVPEEMLTESEKRHEKYRRQQAMAGRFTPAADRLPIMTAEERKERDKDRPNWNPSGFEGPIEKLIEKYKDLEEVKKHLSLGQSMKYDFTEDGKIVDKKGNLIYDGEKIV